LQGFRSPERARALGIMRSYPMPLPELPALAGRAEPGGSWPGARQLAEGLLTLPTHSMLNRREQGELHRMIAAYGN
jgi:hypothetical protein